MFPNKTTTDTIFFRVGSASFHFRVLARSKSTWAWAASRPMALACKIKAPMLRLLRFLTNHFEKAKKNPNLMLFFPQESCYSLFWGRNWLKKFQKCEPGWDKHFVWKQEWMFETTLKKLCKRLQVNISKIAEMTICVCKRHAYEWWMKTEETIEDQH